MQITKIDKTNYIIVDDGTVAECLDEINKHSWRILSIKEVWNLRKNNIIPMTWYDVAEWFIDGEIIIPESIKDYRNISGRPLYLSDIGDLGGNNDFYDSGRFVVVEAPEVHIMSESERLMSEHIKKYHSEVK